MKKKTKERSIKRRNPVFKFGGKILLQSRFGFSQSHICIELRVKIKNKKKVQSKKRKQKKKHKKNCIQRLSCFYILLFQKKKTVLLVIYI